MAEHSVIWRVLPKAVDANGIQFAVHVLPRLAPVDVLPEPFCNWPAFIADPKVTGFKVQVDGKQYDAALDRSEITGWPIWCRLMSGAALPTSAVTVQSATSSPRKALFTTNGAGAAAETVTSAKNAAFAAVSNGIVEHHHAQTLASVRNIGAAAASVVQSWENDLRFFATGDVSTTSAAAAAGDNDFSAGAVELWLRNIGDGEVRAVVERNLFRLAGDPFTELTPSALVAFMQISSDQYGVDEQGRPLVPPPQFDNESPKAAAIAMLRPMIFHRRVLQRDARQAIATAAATNTASMPYTFNERLALLNQQPALMRAVGLVLSFSAAIPNAATTLKATGDITLIVPKEIPAAPGQPAVVFPFDSDARTTAYEFSQGSTPRFAAAKATLLDNGFLITHGDGVDYCLQTLDPDGSAQKLVATVNGGIATSAAKEYKVAPVPDTQKTPFPPYDRSIGIAVVDCKRSETLVKRVRAAAPAANVILTADDLTGGFIPEVRSDVVIDEKRAIDEKRWSSLTRRTENFVYGEAGANDADLRYFNGGERDAVLRDVLARAVDQVPRKTQQGEKPPADYHVGESLFRWDGWSLGAPRPFDCVLTEHGTERLPAEGRPEPWTLISLHKVPKYGTVPLRFGRHYWFRLKAADLAGDSMATEDRFDAARSEIGGKDGFPYLRYDPVPHPVVLLTAPLDPARKPGESLRELVLPKPLRGIDTQVVARCLVPPSTSFRLAEQHGMFDVAGADPERGGFDDVRLEKDTDEHGHVIWRFSETKVPGDAASLAQPIYRKPTKEQRNLPPYWPDPLARALCVRIEDLVSGEVIDVKPRSFYEGREWPRANRLMLRLQARGKGTARLRTAWHETPTTLVIALPPGWVAKVSISSGLPKECAHHMAHFAAWDATVGASLREDHRKAVEDAVVCGCHPMISPCEELLLVHPVRKPLEEPEIRTLQVTRRLEADPTAALDVTALVDRKSVGQATLRAAWDEVEDDPSKERPRDAVATDDVVTVDVQSPEEANDYDPQGLSPIELDATHRFPDTKFREVRYTVEATSRFRRYFPETDDGQFVLSSKPTVARILNASRPDVPRVEYVVPTFGWSHRSRDIDLDPRERFESTRRGGGLRIYLARPWFSTGKGELLGVVLWPNMTDEQCASLNQARPTSFNPPRELPPSLEKYVTRWGIDPIRQASKVPFLPTPLHFGTPEGKVQFGCNLPLSECDRLGAVCDDSHMRVTVAGYTPRFDEERRLWYCDITVRPVPSYFTFIRLALVRYQPGSLPRVELSNVALAEFAQLLPDRSVSVTRIPDAPRSVIVHVFGENHLPDNVIDVRVEKPCQTSRGTMAWIPDPDAVVSGALPKGRSDALTTRRIDFSSERGKRRIAVLEYECMDADAVENGVRQIDKTMKQARLVYADVLEI